MCKARKYEGKQKMILLAKKLDFITTGDIISRTNKDVLFSELVYEKSSVDAVLLDTRPFDVSEYPNLKVISRVGVGIDNIDINECTKRSIKVFTTPCHALTRSVAEFTVKQLLNLMSVNEMRDNLYNKYIMIIGYGRIGSEVGNVFSMMGCDVVFYDKDKNKHPTVTGYDNFLKYISEVDVVCVHTSGTNCMLGKKEIDLLKDNCYVLNMARRGCVDFDYLHSVIMGGKNIKYASDVDCLAKGFSVPHEYFYITPHIASKTVAARKAMETLALDNLCRGLNA